MSRLVPDKSRTLRLPLLGDSPGRALTACILLFAAIFAARFAVGTLGDAITFLYVVPVVVAGVAFGVSGGMIAGAVAFALSSLWAILADVPLSPLGYVDRAVVFAFVGILVGRCAERLRALEAESARHLSLSRDMICIAGFDGCFKHVNPAFERTLGYKEGDLLGRPFLDFVHPEDRERTAAEAAAVNGGSGTVQFQNRYLDKDGRVHWLEWTSSPVPEDEVVYAVARDITDRKAIEAKLERLARRDSLTGLLNRRSFDEALARQLAYTRRYGRGGAVLIIDLDRFKQINDEYGHPAGDEALRRVAQVLQANLRQTDSIARNADRVMARLGGDEFAVLLPETDAHGAEVVAERLVSSLAAVPLLVAGHEVRLSLSVGAALFDEYGRPEAKELLAAADRAMYAAKAAGGSDSVLAATAA